MSFSRPENAWWWVTMLIFVLFVYPSGIARAELQESVLSESIVRVNAYNRKNITKRGLGFVVQSDRFNTYVVTSSLILDSANSTTVSDPRTGKELLAQILRNEPSHDFALLKINGLNMPAIEFSRTPPVVGDMVWSAMRWDGGDTTIRLARGVLRKRYQLTPSIGLMDHTAMPGRDAYGSVLFNECGQVIGLNMTLPGAASGARAIDLPSLRLRLKAHNIKVLIAESRCVSEITQARNQAEGAMIEAKKAQQEAARAQTLVASLEAKLLTSSQRNEALSEQIGIARERADSAIAAAEATSKSVEINRLELEYKTASLQAEARAMQEKFERTQVDSQEKFARAIKDQQNVAASRDRILIAAVLAILATVFSLIWYYRGTTTPAPNSSRNILGQGETLVDVKSTPGMLGEKLREIVLDGRDDDGIRSRLRIPGEKLKDDNGVVIGRNPKDSPYVINHSDVSRNHVRIKLVDDRIIIEDLGSTNGTFVNGQSIEDQGLVAVDSGDQIVIGSVVMDLRILAS